MTCGSCAAGSICDGNTCQACDVTCTGTAAECGAALQTAIAAAAPNDTLYICPGTYLGGFQIDKALTVIGTGQDDDPTADTILDGFQATRVVTIFEGTGEVTLVNLRIQRSINSGIGHRGALLTMRDCTITECAGSDAGGVIAGVASAVAMTRCTVSNNRAGSSGGGLTLASHATLTDCVITGNTAISQGGGIAATSGSDPLPQVTLAGATKVEGNRAFQGGGMHVLASNVTIGAECRITGNTASRFSADRGGGIYLASLRNGTVTLEDDDPSPIVVDNWSDNCAGEAIAKCAPGGFCPPQP